MCLVSEKRHASQSMFMHGKLTMLDLFIWSVSFVYWDLVC